MPADFLQLEGKRIAVFGVANRKSVAWHVVQELGDAGVEVALVVRSPERRESVAKLAGDLPIFVCDVEFPEQIEALAHELSARFERLDGIVHSIAFGDYSEGPKPFHETNKEQFLRALDISCFSLVAISNAFKDLLTPQASVVTVSISTTRMASENYGFMAPVKAALDSSLAFLAKSFSNFSEVRFNAVAPGLLKTSASAGIPGYVDSYLYAERATLRGRAVQTAEVAATVAFLLSPKSSGINAQRLVIDAGMEVNYFDQRLIAGFLGTNSSGA
ncbi:enoyl-ACP reductase FabI [Bythopirellula goksoeyrii]|uniref:Enoyl-[acyl-carrier-protein] reductase [NADH] n=1 Tax=Bythopirellula goksoeyrii TaxID=1400387 RepID=A0A5B9QLY0_9BACT|nr:SDR family oxidoreductase [Bythopirellula goksoeyrii]QEG35003.1 Enoyl-[acyl-carrier-protein] reductase [NADH] FabI [Bythopirellula goksoeyrii]